MQAATQAAASALAQSTMRHLGGGVPSGEDRPVEHVVLVDARLWQESHGEIERSLRPNAEAVYIARPCQIAIYVHGKTKEQLAAIKSWNWLFHGSPYDAQGQPIGEGDDVSAAASIEVLGSRLSVRPEEVSEIVATSTPEQRHGSRLKYAAYWELRDAMVLMRDATAAHRAPFYLYACNLAKIAGFRGLFAGFGRPVYGSDDVTGPPPRNNWLVEWASEGNAVSPSEAAHAETDVFERPGRMTLELVARGRPKKGRPGPAKQGEVQ
jgi:hypothetical protein